MQNLKIYQKTYDAVQYIYKATIQFPKSEKFTLAADIKNTTINILRLIIIANKTKNKKSKLYEIDVELEILRHFIRLSKDLGFLPFKKYENISEMLAEIGKMLGGWIKIQG